MADSGRLNLRSIFFNTLLGFSEPCWCWEGEGLVAGGRTMPPVLESTTKSGLLVRQLCPYRPDTPGDPQSCWTEHLKNRSQWGRLRFCSYQFSLISKWLKLQSHLVGQAKTQAGFSQLTKPQINMATFSNMSDKIAKNFTKSLSFW